MEIILVNFLIINAKNKYVCGIIGFITNNSEASKIAFRCLKNLEYRGYDSCGGASLHEGMIIFKKGIGKIDEVEEKLRLSELPGNVVIYHTRWATHGKVSERNAHPHFDCKKELAIVHNGIIENFLEIKKELEKKGHEFKSETDTEIIAHLIEDMLKEKGNVFDATVSALKLLEGSYALLVLHKGFEGMIAARKGSPLVLGVAENGLFASSDIPSFLEFTRNVVYLKDGDVALLKPDEFRIFNLYEKKWINRQIDTVEWDIEKAKKGEFEHYMLKEICEQVETIKRAIMQDERIINDVVKEMIKARGVFFVGCGTSYHACVAASYIFSKIANMHVNVVLASEFPNFEHFICKDTLVFAVSQSGETYDVLEAVRAARKRNAKVISIVNVMGSTLTNESDKFLLMNAGPEISVVATKTYTAQLALLSLLAYALVGKIDECKDKLNYLWNIIYHLTARSTREKIKELAEKLRNAEHIFCIGRGLQYATAMEASLKIKEVSYIHAEALAGGELKHGTLALIENDVPCIVFVSKENEKEILSNAIEIKSRGGKIIGVASENNKVFDEWIKVPEASIFNPIIQIIPIQLLAYYLAVLRGCDPDKPRNLAKSVTVK